MQAFDGCRKPGNTSGLAGPLEQREVQHLICWHLNQLVANAAGDVARVPSAECV